MWYECLPCMGIIFGCILWYQKGSVVIHNAFHGRPYALDTSNIWQRGFVLERDARISGSPWVSAGLENIPDD